MYSLRYKDIKAACAKAVNLCATDNRVIEYVNRACERLLYEARWKGTTQTFRLCINADGCVVWPREIETIEAVALCNWGAPVRSEWFEFSENGFGVQCSENSCLHALIDRGEVPAFDEVLDPDDLKDRRLAVYADKTESANKYIWLQFYDVNGQWVRTQIDGVWYDGERVTIPTTAGTYAYTTNKIMRGGLKRVKKDVTNGVIRLYEHNTTTAALRPLAYYQPDEEVPMYRRSLIPNYSSDSCEQQSVVVAAKLRFIPVRGDEDFVQVSHREAIRLACKAIFEEENQNFQEATTNWALAHRCLEKQLSHYKGAEKITLNVQSSATFGGGGIGVI